MQAITFTIAARHGYGVVLATAHALLSAAVN